MRENKQFTRVLAISAVAIWSVIGYQVYSSLDATEDNDGNSSLRSRRSKSDKKIAFSYTRDVRDPFAFRVTTASMPNKNKPTTPPKPAWTPPPLKLTGIVASGRKHTAMLEGPDGAVHFLKEGDTLRGVRLVRIDRSTVRYVYQRKRNVWVLPAN